jgi:hypothetical protein
MKYDVAFFIEKFEKIPEYKWTVNEFERDGKCCAQGHCGVDLFNCCEIFMASSSKDLPESWKEGYYLLKVFEKAPLPVWEINNKKSDVYPQPTPKQRVLAALYDIKAKQKRRKPKVERIYIPVIIPETILKDKEIVLS